MVSASNPKRWPEMQIIRESLNPYDIMMPNEFRRAELSLPPTDPKVLAANLMYAVEHEEENPGYWGPRIREYSERLGC